MASRAPKHSREKTMRMLQSPRSSHSMAHIRARGRIVSRTLRRPCPRFQMILSICRSRTCLKQDLDNKRMRTEIPTLLQQGLYPPRRTLSTMAEGGLLWAVQGTPIQMLQCIRLFDHPQRLRPKHRSETTISEVRDTLPSSLPGLLQQARKWVLVVGEAHHYRGLRTLGQVAEEEARHMARLVSKVARSLALAIQVLGL